MCWLVRVTAGDAGDPAARRRSAHPIIRVVGGPGNDEVRYESDALATRFYDSEGDNRVTGAARSQRINSKPYDPRNWQFGDSGVTDPDRAIHWGDWMKPDGSLDFSSDFGLFLGLGFQHFNYGCHVKRV